MATFEKPRIVVEQSPWATALPALADTVVNLYSLSKQMELRASEAQLARDFTITQGELSFARQLYVGQKEREALLEEQVLAIGALPDSGTTSGGQEIMGMNSEGLFEEMQGTENYMDTLQTIISQQKAGIKDIKGLQDRFANIIEAGKDDALKDLIITGSLEIDPATGEPVGSDEWEAILNKLKTGTKAEQLEYEKFRSGAYISGIEETLRTVEQAKNLQAIDLQLESLTEQIETSKQTLRERKFTHAVAQHEEIEGQIGEIYKNVALGVKSSFRYVSDGVVYDLPSLLTIAATEPSDFLEIKSNFLSDPANYDIAHEAEQFLSGIQTAAISDVDDAEYVARFAKQAYDDFLLLKEYEGQIAAEAARENKTIAELYRTIPSTDANKIAIERLRAKQEGYKRLGIYDMGMEMLDRASSIVSMHNDQQALRLNIDVEEADRISKEGLGLQDIETYYPSRQIYMTPKMQRDLDWSLESLKSTTPPPGRKGGTDIQSFITSIQETEQAEEIARVKFEDVSSKYSDALNRMRSTGRGNAFQGIMDRMKASGMLQNIDTEGNYIPAGYTFTQKEMDFIEQEVLNLAVRWRGRKGGYFSMGPSDAIGLLRDYQEFKDSWNLLLPAKQERAQGREDIMDALNQIGP